MIRFAFPPGTELPEARTLVLIAGRQGCVLRAYEPDSSPPQVAFAVPARWTDDDTATIKRVLQELGMPAPS